jgi:hypothetical protein
MTHVLIRFEIPGDLTADELHELLCKAIHEQDGNAQDRLAACVLDIKLPETPEEIITELARKEFHRAEAELKTDGIYEHMTREQAGELQSSCYEDAKELVARIQESSYLYMQVPKRKDCN